MKVVDTSSVRQVMDQDRKSPLGTYLVFPEPAKFYQVIGILYLVKIFQTDKTLSENFVNSLESKNELTWQNSIQTSPFLQNIKTSAY